MSENHNIFQSTVNDTIPNSQDLLGKTLTQTQILNQSKLNLLNNLVNRHQIVKGAELIMNKNANGNIPQIQNRNDIPKNIIPFNDIYIIYNYQNFNDKFMKKNGKIIDNIDMNNETEFTYESKKKIMNEKNLFSKSIKMLNTNNINQEDKVELKNDQILNNSQKINKISQIKSTNLDINNINNNIISNQIPKVNQEFKPISIQLNRTHEPNLAINLNQENKPKESIMPSKINEINQPLPNINFDNIDYSKIKTNEESRWILSMQFNSTVNSRLVDINKKEDNTNNFVDLKLSFPRVPTKEKVYELV